MSTHGNYRAARTLSDGYILVTVNGKCVREHVVVAERALGKPLPPGAVVHHVDENRSNNAPSNLVICPSHSYHGILHGRMRTLKACGNADWGCCSLCKTYRPKDELVERKRGGKVVYHAHQACLTKYARERRNGLKRNTAR